MNIIAPFLLPKGGYKKLRAYQIATLIYDITFYFAYTYFPKNDRTIDQMVQAARSGKQNIAEGSEIATTSVETEIKLTNVAKASLEELLIDYEDYLRVRNKSQWTTNHLRFEKKREYARSEKIFTETSKGKRRFTQIFWAVANFSLEDLKIENREISDVKLIALNELSEMIAEDIDQFAFYNNFDFKKLAQEISRSAR